MGRGFRSVEAVGRELGRSIQVRLIRLTRVVPGTKEIFLAKKLYLYQ